MLTEGTQVEVTHGSAFHPASYDFECLWQRDRIIFKDIAFVFNWEHAPRMGKTNDFVVDDFVIHRMAVTWVVIILVVGVSGVVRRQGGFY